MSLVIITILIVGLFFYWMSKKIEKRKELFFRKFGEKEFISLDSFMNHIIFKDNKNEIIKFYYTHFEKGDYTAPKYIVSFEFKSVPKYKAIKVNNKIKYMKYKKCVLTLTLPDKEFLEFEMNEIKSKKIKEFFGIKTPKIKRFKVF